VIELSPRSELPFTLATTVIEGRCPEHREGTEQVDDQREGTEQVDDQCEPMSARCIVERQHQQAKTEKREERPCMQSTTHKRLEMTRR
jgi:hypothetical protein